MSKKLIEERIKLVKKLRDVQANDKDIHTSQFQAGYYTGLELALSILEDRDVIDIKDLDKKSV